MTANKTRAKKKIPLDKKTAARKPRVEMSAGASGKQTSAREGAEKETGGNASAPGRIGAAEALSFLKETKGEVSWTTKEMASTLNIATKEAADALAVLQIQGYVRPVAGEWMTTPEGEAVAGAKSPRYARASVEQAIAALRARMEEMNRDTAAEYKVTKAVAFGDFLSERPQVQAADVGVKLTKRKTATERSAGSEGVESAVEQASQKKVLQKLRARTAMLNLHPHEEWMGHRSHRKIV